MINNNNSLKGITPMFDFKKANPLADAAKKIMQENGTRRQIETMVNESYGIQSRRQLPNEKQAEYDQFLSQALTEGLQDISKIKSLLESRTSVPINKELKDEKGNVYGHVWKEGAEWHGEHGPTGMSWAADNRKAMEDMLKSHHASFVANLRSEHHRNRQWLKEGTQSISTSQGSPSVAVYEDQEDQTPRNTAIAASSQNAPFVKDDLSARDDDDAATDISKREASIQKDLKDAELAEGKDIGKPGKNFKKIEGAAEKEYGSKEAGARVAGAILSKLRAKHPGKYPTHVKEDQDDGDWAKEAVKKYTDSKKKSPKRIDESKTPPTYNQVMEEIKKNLGEQALDEGFNNAFDLARKSGETTFTYHGKSYNTRMKGETDNQWKSNLGKAAPTPATPTAAMTASRETPEKETPNVGQLQAAGAARADAGLTQSTTLTAPQPAPTKDISTDFEKAGGSFSPQNSSPSTVPFDVNKEVSNSTQPPLSQDFVKQALKEAVEETKPKAKPKYRTMTSVIAEIVPSAKV